MQIRTADRAARHLDDRVPRILDLGIGDGITPNIFLAVPNESLQAKPPTNRPLEGGKSWRNEWFLYDREIYAAHHCRCELARASDRRGTPQRSCRPMRPRDPLGVEDTVSRSIWSVR